MDGLDGLLRRQENGLTRPRRPAHHMDRGDSRLARPDGLGRLGTFVMDLATLIGYVLAWGALAFGIFHASHGAVGAYINPFELIVVAGCAFGAAIASMPLHSVINAMVSTKKLIFGGDAHIEHLIKEMVQYAETAGPIAIASSVPPN